MPDLYKGQIGIEAEEANHLMSELDFPTAVQEICTIAKWAKDTGASTVGVTGFCMGSALALCALQACDDIAAGVPTGGTLDAEALHKRLFQPLAKHFVGITLAGTASAHYEQSGAWGAGWSEAPAPTPAPARQKSGDSLPDWMKGF